MPTRQETICMRSACAESPYVPNRQATFSVAPPSLSSLGPSARARSNRARPGDSSSW